MHRWVLAAVLALTTVVRADDTSKLHVEYMKSVDFAGFKTYAWAPFQDKAQEAPHHLKITRAIEQELQEKGLKKADSPETANLLVRFREALEKKFEGTPSRVDSPWQPSNPRFIVDFSRVEIGTLVVDFWDPERKDVVWQGKASRRMGSADEIDSEIGDLVHEMLAGFPPKGKATH
jgi:hypothetical protein